MARRRGAGIALLGLVGPLALVAPAATAAPGTVYATGFEDGTGGWAGRGTAQLAVSAAAARTGEQGLAVTGRTDTWHGPGLDAREVMHAGTYEVEAWVRLPEGSGTDVVTASVARTPTGGTTAYDTVAWQVPVSDGGWTRVAGTYTHATAVSQLELYLESPDATQDLYVDDVRIVGEAAAPVEPGTGTALSSGFETGLEGWGPRGDAQVATTTADARSGSASLAVTNRLQSWQGPTRDVTEGLAVGQTVSVSVWVKLAPGEAPASLRVSVQRDRAGTPTAYENVGGASGVVTADAWTELKGTYTLGAPVDTAQVYVEGDAGVDFLVDDFALRGVVETPVQDVPPLKDVLGAQGFEHVGVAIDQRETVGRPSALLQRHFDAFTPENDGKPESVQRVEGQFTFANLDRLLDYADATGTQVYGHVLVWHSQTPAWFFKDGDRDLTSSPADQAILRARMEAHIKGIADHIDARYPDGDSPIWAWDVVNEVIADGDTANPHDMRDSRWFQVLGETFVDEAFRLADRYFPQQQLFINDYNTEMPAKRADYLSLVRALKARGVPIDGVGHQAHVDFARPVQWLDDSLTAVERLDPSLLQVITELDVSDSKENNGADVSNGTVPQHSPAMPEGEAATEVGYYYRDLFAMLRRHAASVESVTFWGISNARSWLRTWPAARPWEEPLPFDDDLQAAPAYWGTVDPAQLAPRPADVLPPRIAARDAVRVTTSGTSARVAYALPEAGDTRDGRIAPTCAPASGSRFPLGTTTVTCTAQDSRGNRATPGTFDVVVTRVAADLEADVTGPASLRTGATGTWTLTVRNDGPTAAEGVTAVLAASGVKQASATGGAGTGTVTVAGTKVSGTRWTVPSLAPGASATFTLTGRVTAPRGRVVAALGAVASRTADPAPRDNVDTALTRVAR
ncbi:endo-1,4-beta-xylanase [Vallicoccus soli]|uniref:Beta-xylanase n=1 Tax=Vallicoccus soli TaxID=2339232 RepID=A0A3A3ZHK1_9ACTN|nr:endo-1,4-beta-xylanase [Vallicoccus soli]RJK94746.1 HYR domain-containing protein [Vallicoccus soli]